MAFSANGLLGELHFLLDVTFAGQTIRVATQRLTATLKGVATEYHPGLVWQRSWTQDLSPFTTSAPSTSVSLTIYFPEWFDVGSHIADGHNPGSGTAVLSLYSVNDKHAEVLIDGKLRDPRWGAAGEPFVAMLEQTPMADTGVIQTRRQRILAASWSAHDSTWNKVTYPVIIGGPSGSDSSYVSGSQGYLVDTGAVEKVLIANGHTYAGANGDDVYVGNFSQPGTSEYAAAANTFDDLGQPVTTVDVSAFVTPPVAGDVLWIAWRSAAGVQTFGVLADDQTNPLRGAGDVLIYLARLSRGLLWDYARLDTVREHLNQYVIDGPIQPAIGETITPYQWIQAHIFERLPVSLELGPRGLYVRWWDFTADASDAEVELVEGHGGNCNRISLAGTTALDDVLGAVVVNYAYNHRTSSARESTLLSGDQVAVDDDEDGMLDPWLRRARLEYGDRPGLTIDLEMVDERSTAVRIASAYAKRGGCQRAQVVYSVEQYPGGLLEPGSVVLLTDASLGWTKLPGIVQVAEWTEESTREIVIEVPIAGTGSAA